MANDIFILVHTGESLSGHGDTYLVVRRDESSSFPIYRIFKNMILSGATPVGAEMFFKELLSRTGTCGNCKKMFLLEESQLSRVCSTHCAEQYIKALEFSVGQKYEQEEE